MNLKSERLKKLENELSDLQQWLKLGLVPKKDLEKHREEILLLEKRIQEERERLRFLKESGEMDEYVPPKRPNKPIEPQSLPDLEMGDESMTDNGFEMESESFEMETSTGEETETGEEETATHVFEEEEEEDDPFSDKNRWRRGVLEDPDANEW